MSDVSPLPEEIRTAFKGAESAIEGLKDDLARSATDNLSLRLMLSCVLPIAEQHAVTETEKRTVALIRSALGQPPLAGKPELVIDNTLLPDIDFK